MKKKLVWLLVVLGALLICTAALADWAVEGDYLTYLDRKGAKLTGTQKINNVTYYFDENGHLYYSGRTTNTGTGIYFVNYDGKLVSGWVETDAGKYYFGTDHKALSGWQEISNYFHYFEPDTKSAYYCTMVTGPRTIDGQLCNFSNDGVLLTNNRTVVINGAIYALNANNEKKTGWQVIDGSTYYFGDYYSDDGTSHIGYSAATGGVYMMNSKEHFLFDTNGKQRTGLYISNGVTSYYDPSSTSWGASRDGCRVYGRWFTIGGNRYYFNEEGAAYTGSHMLWNGTGYDYYYFDGDGRMQTGRVVVDSKIYYYDSNGRMITGWYQPNGTDWYYLTTNGALTGLQTLADKNGSSTSFDKYYFSSEGFLQYRWVTLNGRLYYFDPANDGKMITGWQVGTLDANTYYFDPTEGYAVTGQQTLLNPAGTKTYDYFFSNEGKMQTGLHTIEGKLYYYDDSTGERVNGWLTMGNADYYFAPYALTSTTKKLVGKNGQEDFFEFDADGRVITDGKTTLNFVKRCYDLLLGRQADDGGLYNWVNQLRAGQIGAAELVGKFVHSDEFVGQANTNDTKVERLYETMLDRASDPEGKAYWKDFLDAGCSENSVINGFSWSYEFSELCNEYGINAGGVGIEPRDVDPAITGFVNRCYKEGLGREGEPEGMNNWCELLLNGDMDPRQVAAGFALSSEMAGKTASEQIDALYQMYLGREADDAGKADWLNRMNNGATLAEICNGFAYSKEFIEIMNNFGF